MEDTPALGFSDLIFDRLEGPITTSILYVIALMRLNRLYEMHGRIYSVKKNATHSDDKCKLRPRRNAFACQLTPFNVILLLFLILRSIRRPLLVCNVVPLPVSNDADVAQENSSKQRTEYAEREATPHCRFVCV